MSIMHLAGAFIHSNLLCNECRKIYQTFITIVSVTDN